MSKGNMAGLELARKAIEENGVQMLTPQEKFERKSTRKTAIDAKCQSCVCGPEQQSWKWLIANCESIDCSLYEYRPFKSSMGKPKPSALK